VRLEACFALPWPQRGHRKYPRPILASVDLVVGDTNELRLPFDCGGSLVGLTCSANGSSITADFEAIPLRRIGDRLEFDWPVELLAETFRAFVPR